MSAVIHTSQNLSISCRQVTTCRSRWTYVHFVISANIALKNTDWTYIPDFKTFRQSSREVSTSRQTLYNLYPVSLPDALRGFGLHFSSFQDKNQNFFPPLIELNRARYGNLLLWIAPNCPYLHHCSYIPSLELYTSGIIMTHHFFQYHIWQYDRGGLLLRAGISLRRKLSTRLDHLHQIHGCLPVQPSLPLEVLIQTIKSFHATLTSIRERR